MDYLQLIATMPPETYKSLVRSVEIGKWPDGRPVTSEQRENAMQAIIAWGEHHLSERDRIGYIEKKAKAGASGDSPPETPLNWKE